MNNASVRAGEIVPAVAVSAGAQLLGKGIHLGLNVVASLALIRYFGPSGYGDYVFIFSLSTLLGLASDLGIAKVAVREIARDEGSAAALVGTTIITRLGLAAVAAAVAQVLLAGLGARWEIHVAVGIASLLFFTEALLSLAVIFQARIAMQYEALVQVTIQAVDTALILFLISRSADLAAIVAAPVASALIGILLAWVIARRRFALNVAFDRRRIGPLIKESLPVGANLFLAVLYLKLDSVLIGVMRTPDELGFYGAAYKPIEYLLLASAVVVNALFPLLARWYQVDPYHFLLVYRRGTEALLVLALPIPVLLAFTGDALVRVVYGSEFAPAAGALQLLGIAVVLMIFNAWQGFVLLAGGRQRVTLAYNSAGFVINVVLNVILIARAGFIGAAFAALLTSVFITVASGLAGARFVGATLDRVRLFRVLVANVLMAGTVWILGVVGLNWSLVLPLAAITYPGYLLALRVVTADELRLVIPVRGRPRPLEIT